MGKVKKNLKKDCFKVPSLSNSVYSIWKEEIQKEDEM